MRPPAWVALLAVAAACGESPEAPDPPQIDKAAAAPITSNALGAVVSVRVRGAVAVAVRYHVAGDVTGDSVTPDVRLFADTATVPVLGLLPATAYELHVVAHGPGGEGVSELLTLTTDSLPADLPRYTASGADPSSGYVAFAAGKYGLAIDNTGRVVWYHRFEPNGPFLNFEAQPNGRWVGLPQTPDPTDVEQFVEVDALGNETRRLGCVGGLPTRFHDLIAQPAGDYWVMCDEVRTLDLSALGGVAGAVVTGTMVQHVAADGTLLFQWSPFDHFAITDLDASLRGGPTVNWTHGNSLAFDADSNLLVSFRSLSEITKIDVTTGDVLWRMGGLRNEFTFAGTAASFARQHGLRVSGDLLLLDNMGVPGASRAERYALDEDARTARLVDTYSSLPSVVATLGGSVQLLADGHLLVAYGNGDRVEEYDAAGTVVWRLTGDPGYVFRAQRIGSLYHPGADAPR
jgi:arylsulfotransferase ASST